MRRVAAPALARISLLGTPIASVQPARGTLLKNAVTGTPSRVSV